MKIFILGGIVGNNNAKIKASQQETLKKTFQTIAADLVRENHELIVCSAFEDSADYYALLGASCVVGELSSQPTIEYHYPDLPGVETQIKTLTDSLNLTKVRYFSHLSPSQLQTSDANKHAWMLAQITALNTSHIVLTLGGKLDGSASLMLRIAEANRKTIIPLRFLGGTAAQAYDRIQYELKDKLNDDISILNDANRINEVAQLVNKTATAGPHKSKGAKTSEYFISYARDRPESADYICLLYTSPSPRDRG